MNPCNWRKRWRNTESTRYWTYASQSNWCSPLLRRFRILKGRSHSRRMPSAYFWGITRATFLADSHSPRSLTLPKFHPELLHLCWNDGRMFEKPKTASLPPTRRSGWHGRLTFPRSHSPELPVTRVRRLRISSLARPAYGTWPRPQLSPYSREGGSSRMFVWLKHNTSRCF